MSKQRWIYPGNGQEPFEVTDDYVPEPRAGYYVAGDIQPYRSMVDGSIIQSRSRHREHLRQHGMIEVGNDSSVKNPRYVPPGETLPSAKPDLIRALQQVKERVRNQRR